MPFNRIQPGRLVPAIILTTVAVFTIGLYSKPYVMVPVLFVAPVLMTLFLQSRKMTVIVSAAVTMLTLILWALNGFGVTYIYNLIISVTGIWTAFYFILRFKGSVISESKNRERLKALFEYATEGMIITDSKGEIVMVNPMAEKQFAYEQGELIGKNIEVLIPDRFSQRHVKHREKYSQSPYPRPMGKGNPLFAKRKSGSEFPVEISLSNFNTDEGRFIIAFVIDISERRKSEELLQKEKELAKMYLDIAPVIFLVLDGDMKVSLINQKGIRILKYPESEIIDTNWFEKFTPASQISNSLEMFSKLMKGEYDSTGNAETDIITASGETRVISWKYAVIRNETGQPTALLGAGEDITERKVHEAIIAKANEELKQYSKEISELNADLEKRVRERTEELAALIQKLEHINNELAVEIKERKQAEELLETKREELKTALDKERELSELKSRFVTMASHEFRTPLSTILSSVSLISKYNEPGQDEKRIKHIERIKSSVHNLTSILNDFLSLGKLEEGKIQCSPTEFDITTFSNDLTGELREVSKKGQTISYIHTGSITRVTLDKNLTRNICLNLLSNAIKYSDEGKSIQFRTTTDPHRLIISVADQGIGIPENEQQHIFERFFRANNASNIQGTGLGLNIVRKYTDLMKGEVSFKSEYGKGTTFEVVLPIEI